MRLPGVWAKFGSRDADRATPSALPFPASQSPASGRIFRIIDDQLAEERSTKTSLETRASDVIKTSGTLTTLFLAIGAITGGARVHLEWWAVVAFILAVLVFFISAWIATSVASPRAYQELKVGDLRRITPPEIFAESEFEAGPKLTKPYLDMLEAARAAESEEGGQAGVRHTVRIGRRRPGGGRGGQHAD